MSWDIEMYASRKGKSPFEEWLHALDKTMQIRVLD